MTKRMLIDDTQPEETRVAVINGNKLEDVEFESSSRKQIKGNVYLAKVMRIEPSLQAAFVDYGGNRHGFLAFGEIHPDYYHVDEQKMAELEQEVETIIENKKQALKEREIERARIREEKALRRAQRMEQERLEQEAKEKEAEEKAQTEAEETENQNSVSTPIEDNQSQEITEKQSTTTEETSAVKEENVVADDLKSNTQEQACVTPSEQEEIKEQPKKVKRGRGRPKTRRNKENALVQNPDLFTGETTSASSQSTENKIEEKATTEVKTLAADNDLKEEKICEENSQTECCCEKEDCEYCPRDNTNNSEDDVTDTDDDEDNENDFEIQKKLILMRKLFHQSAIQDVIKEGQILLVQVVKEERGNKGAALTTYLSLAGRYCVLMPNRIKSGGVSRKITNVSDRKRLKGIIKELPLSTDMSLIVRTAGEEKTKNDIVRDYNYLIRTWEQIRFSALKSTAPCLIHEEGNLIKRALRDMFTKEISEIIIDGDKAYQSARNFMKILSPHNMKKLKADKPDDIPLFQRFQIEGQLDKLHDTNVQLESGGYLVINPTEALVSIDVNSGRATKEKDLEETALKTNLEAADEIAKQLRMRNLAGLVVIDFIDMDEAKNNLAIEKRMKEAMKQDRARVQIGKMSCFGLLEVSRQRMHSSFFESNYQSCPYCHGRGIVRTTESGGASILRTLEEEGIKNRSSKIVISLPRDTAVYLLNQKRCELVNIEQRYNMQIVICADDSIKNIADYKIERTKQNKENEPETTKEDNNEIYKNNQIFSSNEKNNDYLEPQTSEIISDEISAGEENKTPAENGKNNYRRNSRRYRFDRRRNNRRNQQDNNDVALKTTSEEPAVAYNNTDASAEKSVAAPTEKRKVSWWKKLING